MIHLTDATPPVLESLSWLQQHALHVLRNKLAPAPFELHPIVLTDAEPAPFMLPLVVGDTVHVRFPERWRS